MKFISFLILNLANVFALNLHGTRSSIEAAPNLLVNQFPYQVCISFQQSSDKRTLCSGSLIGNEWILTAAHCAVNATNATVYLGASNGLAAEVIHTVIDVNIIIHSNWDCSNGDNDIALIRIPYTSYSAKIQPIKLPSRSSFYWDFDGDSAIATGWHHGSYNSFSPTKSKLKWTVLEVAPKRACATGAKAQVLMTHSTICAVAREKVSACSADSGGPLVLELSKVQIGLHTLRTLADCSETYSEVFTSITDYLDWIATYTGSSSY